jgi:2OG-Fe(II) oxygenase superfamily
LSLINLDNAEFVYEPFPMGLARPVFEPDLYERLVAAFPGPAHMALRPEQGRKYSLSDQVVNPKEFRRFVEEHELWGEVWAEVRSREFRDRWLHLLRDAGIDLMLLPPRGGLRERAVILRDAARRRYVPPRRPRLRGTMEFSMMPADGGHIAPHTDATDKVVTLVVSMVSRDEWNADWGGGTDMLRAKDPRRAFNFVNRYLDFDEVEVLQTYPFEPNQAVLFVKTFNSLHCVRPMTGPGDAMRRTLTINLRRIY